MYPRFVALISAVLISACGQAPEPPATENAADTLFFGGDILTMAGSSPEYVEALAVIDDRIVFAGDRAEAEGMIGPETDLRDLAGATLMPGFIDSHSHFQLTAIKLSTVNLDPPPAGTIDDIEDIQSALRRRLETNPPAEGEWLFGWGYDNAMLAENRHPTKADLDAVSTEVPIAIYHFSTHMVVLNSFALAESGIDETSTDPEGGVIRRMPGSNEPNGVLEETAILPIKLRMMSMVDSDSLQELMRLAQEEYLSAGFTTAMEMAGAPDTIGDIRRFAESGDLRMDLLVTMLALLQTADVTAEQYATDYENRLRIAGGKINLDGGTPGRTAYLREPYYTQEPDIDAGYRGYSSIEDQEELNAMIASFYENRIPIFVHALGDAAVDQAITAISAAEAQYPRDDIRTQIIHAQVLADDQIDTLTKLDVTVTFQNTHNFYFADFHNEYTLGPERTAALNPMASAVEAGLSVTMHHDSPVHPVSQLDLVWIATNRAGRSGTVYGPDERLTTYQALRASTIEVAYQIHEEDDKGSLEVGKLADLTIVDRNPLNIPIEDIRDLRVVETIKSGETVWQE